MRNIRNKVTPHPFRAADVRQIVKYDYRAIDFICCIRNGRDIRL